MRRRTMRVLPLATLALATAAPADVCTEGGVIAWGAGNARTLTTLTSGNLGNIGTGVSRIYTFTNLPTSIADNATLTIQARADLGDANEFLTVRFNGQVVGEAFDAAGEATDCPPGYSTAIATISPEAWATFAKSGSLEVRLNASAEVDPNQCAEGAVIMTLSLPPGVWPHFGQATPPGTLFPQEVISAGELNTAGIDRFGQLAVWGDNEYGQRAVPTLPSGARWTAVAVGGQHVIAVRDNGEVSGWGWNSNGQATPPAGLPSASAVAAGRRHSLLRSTAGQVRAWGANDFGQSLVPSGLGTSVFIAAGSNHSMSISSAGVLRCWGDNSQGQSTVPADLPLASAVAGGEFHTVALRPDGTVRCFGGNQYGQSDVPAGLPLVDRVAAGLSHTAVLTEAGTVICWGSGSRIRYGNPLTGGANASATAVNGNGSTMVGLSDTSTTPRPFRWGLAGNTRQFTAPTGCWSTTSELHDISSRYVFGGDPALDFGTVVGSQTIPGGERAIRANGASSSLQVLANPNSTWVMDGTRDADSILLAQSTDGLRHLWAGVKCGRLYVATEAAPADEDIFIFLATPPGAQKAAPFGKDGTVATWKSFVRDLGTGSASWYNENSVAQTSASTGTPTVATGAVVEGTIDLVALFPNFIAEFSLVVAPYESVTGGLLLDADMVPPAVTADGSILPREFITRTTVGDTIADATFARANGTNDDGTVIVGQFGLPGFHKPFRWTSGTGMVSLGILAGGDFASATRCDAAGATVVGVSDSTDGERAFRWTSGGGIQSLGVLAGGLTSIANSVSADGSVVVGESDSTDGSRAFYWTAAGGMADLGVLAGSVASAAYGVSGDGTTVVGTCVRADGENRAFLWSVSTGMVDLNDALPGLGVVLGDGVLRIATDISNDGATIVGSAQIAKNTRAFAAELAPLSTIPSNGGPNFGQTWAPPTELPLIGLAAGGYHTAAISGGIGNCYDLNGDGVVDAADLSILLLRWGAVQPGPPPYPDFNQDGLVDAADLSALLLNWGF